MNDLVSHTLYGLSLFSGIGGLDLGVEHILPKSQTICYVEGEIYNAKVLYQKMQRGELSNAPIYSDVRTFPSVAHNFFEKVDFITAGFPCQPFSLAGRLQGKNDERWLWDSILQTIKQTRPSFLFLENVSNLLNEWEAFDEISKSLSEIGFNLEWANVRASDVGANHQRSRLFIFAYKPGTLSKIDVTNPNKIGWGENFHELCFKKRWGWESNSLWEGITITNPDGKRRKKPHFSQVSIDAWFTCRENNERKHFTPKWWERMPPFPPLCRVDDGISYGMDRLRSLGNAVVPLQASQAYYNLIQRAIIGLSRS
jgi:site-specific DNA-cytosine methylase